MILLSKTQPEGRRATGGRSLALPEIPDAEEKKKRKSEARKNLGFLMPGSPLKNCHFSDEILGSPGL